MRKLWVLLPIIVFILGLPLLQNSSMPLGHDLYAHLTYTKLFEKSLNEGQFPVRWVEWIRPGFAHPLFNYYQVGFYYLVFLIDQVLSSFILSIKFAIFLLWGTGTIFTFLFAKKYGLMPAVLAALVYTLSPYLILDIFVRNAFPEFMAISLMPAVFWAADKVIDKAKIIYSLLLSLFLGIALFSHLPTVIIFLPIFLGYCLFILFLNQNTSQLAAGMNGSQKNLPEGILRSLLRSSSFHQKDLPKRLLLLLAGIFPAFGFSAFYLIPAIFEQKLIQIDKIATSAFDFHRYFIDIRRGFLNDEKIIQDLLDYNFQLRFVWVTTIAMSIGGLLVLLKKKIRKTETLFWVGTIVYTLFFVHQSSALFWERISFLRFIQFPWRFFMLTPFAFAMLFAVFLEKIHIKYQLISLFVVIVSGLAVVFLYLAPVKYIDSGYFNLPYNLWIVNPDTEKVAYIEPAYFPKGVKTHTKNHFKFWNVEDSAEVIEKKITSTNLIFDINLQNSAEFTVSIPYFPGWSAYINGQEASISKVTEFGFINIQIPKGFSQVQLKFENTQLRTFANAISLISFLVTLFILAGVIIKKKLLI